MKNKHGQALVEFILILPVLLLILFALFDFGRILLCKMHLENVMNEISGKDEKVIANYLQSDTEYTITYQIKKDKYEVITLESKLDLITPGLKNILNSPYTVSVERSILYE